MASQCEFYPVMEYASPRVALNFKKSAVYGAKIQRLAHKGSYVFLRFDVPIDNVLKAPYKVSGK